MKIQRKIYYKKILKDNKGQSFMEFIFLFIILILMSFLILKFVNIGVADRWVKIVSKVVADDPDNVKELPLYE